MLIINNPNNPSGVRIPTPVLTQIVSFAREHDLILLSDEVYRPLFHTSSARPPPSALSYDYENILVTASMSKAFSLAGLRIGWIATRSPSIIQRLAEARDHTTISVSSIDDALAAYALSNSVRKPLLRRNNALANENLGLLAALVARYPNVLSWTHPDSGTTAFIQFRKKSKGGTWQPVEDDAALCIDILEKTKVMVVPGSRCFGRGVDFPGYVRVGYVCDRNVLVEALSRLDEYIAREFVEGV
jgi:aspartate/methionine/tyrosine aminotransferase